MTVQLPVLIWTVINFCLFMWLMNKLLFKPLLTFMDARQEKIDRARKERERQARARAEALRQAEEERLAAEKRAHSEAEAALIAARRDAAAETAQKEAAYAALLAGKKTDVGTEKQRLQQQLDGGMDELVSAFVQKLTL